MPIAIKPFALLAVLAFALPAAAQHHQGHGGQPTGSSPYAGQQSRDIKALSETEMKELAEGAGMGFAKAAELNRYPGPTHTLEHADALRLTPEQRERLAQLVQRHKAEARRLGERVIATERELDALFAKRDATPEAVERVSAEWGLASAKLRAEHLKTHLETTRLLTPQQVERYVELRGYGSPSAARHRH